MNVPVSITAALALPEHRTCYYGGAWHAPKSGREADTINPGTGESLGKVADAGAADVDAAVAAAKAAFQEWRNVLPLERAKMLRRIAEVLREHAQELAMIDAADCGNPVAEMVSDAMVAAAQTEFFAGLVTEMKGSSMPMGPGVVNFSVREPRGVVGAHHPVQSSVHVLHRQVGGAARGRQHRGGEAARAVAALLAAAGRADRRHPAARRVQRGARRQGMRRGARRPPGRRDGGAGRQRADRPRRDARGRRHREAGDARARRQERADRLSGRRPGRGRGRRDRRHELHLVRAVLRLDQPRLHPREDLRRGAGAGEGADQALQARHPDRSRHHHGGDRLEGAVRPGDELHRLGEAGRRAAASPAAARRTIRRSPRASTSSRPCSPT